MRLFDFFDKTTQASPHSPAIRHCGRDWSYLEIGDLSGKLAAALNAVGLPPGAKVATWLPNHPLFVVAQLGVHRTRYVWMPINPRANAAECIANMQAFGARFLIIHADFAEHVPEIRREVPSLAGIVVAEGALFGCPDLLDWIAPHAPLRGGADVGATDAVTLITTGGTTGKPKGINRISMNWATLIANYRISLTYEAPPVFLAATPMTHVAGEVAHATFAQGGLVVIPEKPTPAGILAAIPEHKVTTLFAPPTLLYMLLAEPDVRDHDYSSLRYIKYGAAPMSLEKLKEAWSVFGPVLTQLYGLMEATSTVSIMPPWEHAEAFSACPERLRSCGRGSPFIVIDVFDGNGNSVPPGERGEVVLRGNGLMAGYDSNPDATAAAIVEGWFHTGDVGTRDEEGYLYIVDRTKDVIISGGFNVFPGEIEQVIWAHPAVKDCAVVGVPDEKWGEAVAAVVELKPGMIAPEDEIISLCKKSLGSIRTPKKIFVWDHLPRSNVGKVLKKEIRARYWPRDRKI